ncbi:uncharacterized protein FFUJ_09791 [Fusarium fujikuroi IMI 58289]|uniref:Chromo domain-containing protein n=1 Tax=Gibberella fujikuroi (strain CBS 195.34 / IMI 58289 / NRRL A-6831) TaxID=1279085 RepID=S0EF69_GIBF5|nr:uncharacterized protein FFUJ_09791 [Fusarium fujikuroi IMI 58289]CCT73419.1 uncharacterized protein FFUJ_09791 [Fusarium fujikuroi IMI 58289]SCO17258.1 uncharacterized protein FFM5_11547 [Fusarium fujikuroi]
MDDSDNESIVSTIVSEHDSDEEWNVNEILAEWPIDGLPRYLIEWENFDLCEATWEPVENLSNALLEGWEKTKSRDDFDMFKNIRDWKNAVKSKYAAKLDRHQERNRRRKLRGEDETSFMEMEDHLKWANRFPDGEEPSGSVVSSPSVATDIDMDVEVGQLSQHSFDKTQRASVSLSEDSSPKSSRQNSIASVHHPSRPPMNSAATTTTASFTSSTSQKPPLRRQPSKVLVDNKRPPQKPVASSNLLSSKFGVRGPIKRADSHLRKGQPTKARKTRPAQAFTGNVFSGGIVRKQRTTLAEAAKDSTKQSKLLKPRYVNLIQKAGRDRESAAPVRLPTDLISLNPAERSINGLNALPLRPEIPNETVKPLGQNKNSTETIPEAQKSRPKKSISWGTVEEATIPARGEREESLFLREDSLIRATTPIKIEDDCREAEKNTGPQSESTLQTKASDNQECWAGRAPVMNDESSSSNKSITTEVQFGPGSRETFSVIFERDEDQNGQPWSGIFEQHPILIFTHSCTTRDFWSQETALAAAKLGTGSVTSIGDPDSLATVANWLCVRSVGVLLYHQELCIFLYASFKESVLLHYYLFRSSPHLTTRSLAPIVLPEGVGGGDVLPQMIPTVFNRLLGFQYEQLLPEKALMDYSNHNFFLVFPTNAVEEAHFLSGWLRSCNPQCRLLSSLTAGHWAGFRKLDQGVVIVHEEAIWATRLFPSVWTVLHNVPNFNFRLFSISLQPAPFYPSLGQPARIGDVTLQTICGQKKAVLVTPSFVISQPQQAWAFFKWAYKYWQQHRGAFTLIVCADFENWIHEVAVVVKEDWETRLESTRVREEDKGTAEKEIDALFKCLQHVRGLVGPLDDDQSIVVFAPDSIDGNDEQSLVNWFGWWSILNLDQYRHFTVLGSSPDAGIQRLTHQIRIPEYTPSTLGNPDDVWGKINPAASSLVPQNQSAVERAPQRRLHLVPRDDGVSFKRFLGQLESDIRDRDWGPQTVFNRPVSYWNIDMARGFSEFDTYDRCLRYFNGRIHGHPFINTGVAFCYTIEGSWKYGNNRETTNKNRRPWIAVYRPVDVAKKPWRAMELIIWDPVMKMPDNDPYVYDGQLIEAQREMIRLAEGPHNKLPLRKVWIRGPDVIPQGLSDPVDITIHQLQHLMKNLRESIPAVLPAMMTQGWREVKSGNAPIRSRPPSPEAMDVDEPTGTVDAADEDLKIVFHAPRGKNMDRPTRCKNRLFMHCANKRSEGYRGRTMNFVFRPTLEWYDEQVQEGRGFEHIRVMQWPAFFSKHLIEVPERPDVGSRKRGKEART